MERDLIRLLLKASGQCKVGWSDLINGDFSNASEDDLLILQNTLIRFNKIETFIDLIIDKLEEMYNEK